MAVTSDQIKTQYPLPVYNYRVEIAGEAIAFSEVSGLSIGYETTTYKESPIAGSKAGPVVMHMPAQATQTTVSLKKGLVRAKSITALYAWINKIQTNQIEKKDIHVRLCDEKGEAVITWKVANAFPTKLDAPTFDANGNDAAIESMELIADRVTMEEN